MKKLLSLSMLLTVALLVGAACQSASTANVAGNNANKSANNSVAVNNSAAPKTDAHGHADDAPRISLEEAKKDFDAGKTIFIDTRGEAAYKNEHIKGAINISMDMVEAKYKEIPKDKKIIAYCS